MLQNYQKFLIESNKNLLKIIIISIRDQNIFYAYA